MILDSKTPDGPLAEKWDRYRADSKLIGPGNKRKFKVIVVGTGLAGASAAATTFWPTVESRSFMSFMVAMQSSGTRK